MDEHQMVPLSGDLELRPARSTAVNLSRLLSPMLEGCVRDIEESTARLKQLADEARSVQDLKTESALRAKILVTAAQILRLCHGGSTMAYDEPRPIRSPDDLPDWDLLPLPIREKFEEAYRLLHEGEQLAEACWGPGWNEHWLALSRAQPEGHWPWPRER